MEKVTTITYNQTLTENSSLIIKVEAPWCGPCKAMAKNMVGWDETNYPIKTLDVDEEPELAQELGIRSVPIFIFYKDGIEVKRITGSTSLETIKTTFDVYSKK